MIKKRLLFLTVFLLMIFSSLTVASAENEVTVFRLADITVEDDNPFYVDFSLNECNESITVIDFTFAIPEGFSLRSYKVNDKLKNRYELVEQNGEYAFIYYSGKTGVFIGGESVITLQLTADKETADGEYGISLKTCRLLKSGQEIIPLEIKSGLIRLNRNKPCNHVSEGWTVTEAPTYNSEGKRVKICTSCGTVYKTKTIAATKKRDIADCKVEYKTTAVYNGKRITPKVKITYKGITLKEGTDFTVSYSSNKSVGTAKIRITGKGAYLGERVLSFTIKPKAVRIKKLKAYKNGRIQLTWTKSSQADGYEIYVKAGESGKYKLLKTVKSNSVTSYKTTKFSKNKRYYFKIRAYNINGEKKINSAFCEIKRIRLKK